MERDRDNDLVAKEIIEKTRDSLSANPEYTYQWGKEELDKVYSNETMFEEFNAQTEFWDQFNEDIIFGATPANNDERGTLRIRTRIITSRKIRVLPSIFEYEGETITAESFLKKLIKNKEYFGDNKVLAKGYEKISLYTIEVAYKDFTIGQWNDIDFINVAKNSEYSFYTGIRSINNFL